MTTPRLRQMKGHGSKFGRKKEEAIIALLSQRNIEEAARTIKVAPNTLMRWMKEPDFDKAYREAKREAFGQAIGRLHQMSGAAVTTLGKVIIDPGTPPAVKVRASDSILNHTIKALELEDIEARLDALERSTDQTKPGWRRQ